MCLGQHSKNASYAKGGPVWIRLACFVESLRLLHYFFVVTYFFALQAE